MVQGVLGESLPRLGKVAKKELDRARKGVLRPTPHTTVELEVQGEDEAEPEETIEKNPHAVALGWLEPLNGGKVRAKKSPKKLRD